MDIEPDPEFDMQLQCFPLYSMLMALGNPTVNLLSLDIEGAEFEVCLGNLFAICYALFCLDF